MSLLDNVIAVENWYQAQTGKIPPPSRVLNIMLAIEKFMIEVPSFPAVHYSLPALLDRTNLKVVSDPLWTSRHNRTPSEHMGVLIGKGKDGTRAEFWYLVPKEGGIGNGEVQR